MLKHDTSNFHITELKAMMKLKSADKIVCNSSNFKIISGNFTNNFDLQKQCSYMEGKNGGYQYIK